MAIPLTLRKKPAEVFWVVLSLFVLFPCLYYGYISTRLGLAFWPRSSDWTVIAVNPCPAGQKCFEIGDRLLSLGGLTREEYIRDRNVPLFSNVLEDGTAEVTLERRNQVLKQRVHVQERGKLHEYAAQLFLPFIFWLMGSAVSIFLRPRDERWLILVLFAYTTAIWFSSGFASQLHVARSSEIFHFFVWFFLPLAVHLHLLLPTPLLTNRRRAAVLAPLYLGSTVLAILDSLRALDRFGQFYVASVVVAVGLSLVILLVRFLLPHNSAERVALRIMLAGVFFGLGPFLLLFGLLPQVLLHLPLFAGASPRSLYTGILALAEVGLPLLPMSYVYAIYKHHLGALEFRANRLLGAYSFLALSTTLFVIALFAIGSFWSSLNLQFIASVLLATLLFVWGALFLRTRYQTMIDRHIFGIKHTPEEIIRLVSERLPKAFDRSVLVSVLTDEILPPLFIRQSSLFLLKDDHWDVLYEQGQSPGPPNASPRYLPPLLRAAGRYLPEGPFGSNAFPWARLILPLKLQERILGLWVMGRRDPDDFYPVFDIQLLETVANQVGPILENIRLYEQAQQEIAQRKAAEIAIRRSEERFRTLFEATLEGIAIVRDGIILEVNVALSAILGYAPSELIGRRLTEVIAAETDDPDGVTHEGKGLRKDGSEVDVEIADKKFVLQGEDVTVVAVRDIARRKRDEAENKMLQRQLLHAQKMEAIGRLSAGVAHDFNNCLLAIFGYTDLLRETYADDPFLARNLSGLKEAGQKAAALTKQLLAFARRQPMEARIIDLNPVVSGLEKMMRRLLGEDISLLTELEPALGKVKVDPGQLEQIILNLAVNARDAMPEGGRLTVRTSAVTIDDETRPGPYASVAPGTYVLLTVTDTGVGMDAETQGQVFEPFFSTKGEGTGLGLSTAYGIVQQSRGHILVESAPQRGATFSIFLPVTQEIETPVAAPATVAADRGDETILLVEDEEEVRPVLEQILTGRGYRVLAASSGPEALRIASSHSGLIHLLLTDVTMPRMKGTELASRLLLQRPSTRVVYMSGYNEEGIEESGKICLQKPFSPVTLAQTLRAVLDAPAVPA